jgi:hypothetical protein
VSETIDFSDRFPESKLAKAVENFKTLSLNNIKSDKK